MDLLGGYDSGSDDQDDDTAVATKLTASSASSSSSAAVAAAPSLIGIKKVKKLDVSVLPAAIQIALQRGDDLNDSGSDDDLDIYNNKDESLIASSGGNCYRNLLKQLPQPKKKEETKVGVSKSVAPVATSHSEIVKSTDTIESAATIYKDEDDLDQSLFTFIAPKSDSSTNFQSSHHSMPLLSLSAPVTARPHRNDVHKNEFSNSIYHVSNIQQHSTEYHNNVNESPSNNSNHLTGGEMQMTSSKRKREIEQQLMSGNISVVENSAQLFDVNGGNASWAQEQYMDKKAIEKQILAQYHINDGTMKQITAVNSRRHQINSLVANAAKTELQLLEKGGGGHRKAETRAKYGW